MFIVWVRKSETSPWREYCEVDTFDEGRQEMHKAVEVDGYDEATLERPGRRPE